MTGSISSQTLERLATFGELLRYLRRRAGLTQTDLSIAVGCSDAQISRLEQNLRLPNVANIDARFLPALKLKHEPAARERLLWLAADAHRRWADAAAAPDPGSIANTPSIAVMPFLNLSTDPGNEYFCDGLAEELLNALTKIRRLFVVARASAFSFKGKDLDAREIGRRLNVDTILEGSVKRADDRLRVSVHLINTDNGFQIWSERFDRRMTDLFALQDEITLAIVDQLKVELLEKEKLALLGRHPVNLESFNLYLKGRFYWARRPQGINKAIEYFELAIEKDPRSAVARAGLADCYVTLGSWAHAQGRPRCTGARRAPSRNIGQATRACNGESEVEKSDPTAGVGIMRYDDLYLWFLADPAVPRYVGQLRLVEAGKGVSLQYGADWLAGGFPLSEDLVLTDIEQLPRCARRPRLSRSRSWATRAWLSYCAAPV